MANLEQVVRLSIYLGTAEGAQNRTLSAEILHRAHRAGLRGATTLQGIEGFGGSAKIHSTPTWRLVDRTPVAVHIIDSPERIRAFLPSLVDICQRCLIVCDPVAVARPTAFRG
jgi:PII-like signaling protein